ncbi:MAG: STAS domain-containing protein [Terriglobia bacterium]|jgi:anti-anti-sigma factor
MEITVEKSGEATKLRVKGRLDAYWADHLAKALEAEIRRGSHHLLLDLSEVVFLSSAGIGTLVRFYKQLHAIQGSLLVSEASETVKKILEISRLTDTLFATVSATPAAEAQAAATIPALPPQSLRLETHGALVDVFSCTPEAKLMCRVLGDPNSLRGSRFRQEQCLSLQFPESAFGLGLGALGDSFEECRGRFGEFIAVGGTVAYLPTDGTNVPDFLVAAGTSVPDVQVCYGLSCQGQFAKMARFEAKNEAGAVTLTQLAELALELAEAERVGLVLVAESAGLIGAALRRPPTLDAPKDAPFMFPQVREWLSFTAEPAHSRSLALVVGVAARGNLGPPTPMLRPLGGGTLLLGHFHAAAFSYRPLQKGEIELKSTVKSLFETQALQGLLHLLNDDRAIAGAGQSEFARGACWLAPLGACRR